jgi:hypothetical protein
MLLAIGLDSAVRCPETRIGRARSPWSLVVEAGSGDGGEGGGGGARRFLAGAPHPSSTRCAGVYVGGLHNYFTRRRGHPEACFAFICVPKASSADTDFFVVVRCGCSLWRSCGDGSWRVTQHTDESGSSRRHPHDGPCSFHMLQQARRARQNCWDRAVGREDRSTGQHDLTPNHVHRQKVAIKSLLASAVPLYPHQPWRTTPDKEHRRNGVPRSEKRPPT